KLLSATYTCTAVVAAQQDSPPYHFCQEDFRYKEPVKRFIEPSTLIPLLGQEEAPRGSSTLRSE
ncbi:hypothetical protein A2U01_0060060, partial [Trifolium medium]|nr:hypothetical protein [Trifolium medium]